MIRWATVPSSHRTRTPTPPPSWNASFVALASTFLLGVIAGGYSGVTEHDFVDYDDTTYVVENPNVRGGLSLTGLRWAFTTGYAANWHPLTWLSHMLDVELFGLDPGSMAGVNVAIHAVSSLLLFTFFWRATGSGWAALIVALLFAIHPLRVESVAWIAERKDVLAGLFFMTTLIAWHEYTRRPSAARYALVLVAYACGLMSKPTLVTLPFVLLLLDVWPFERIRLLDIGIDRGATPGRATRTHSPMRLVTEKLPLLLMSVGSSLLTLRIQAAGGAMPAEDVAPFGLRVANALVAYATYVRKFLWPSDLACFYPLPDFGSSAGTSPVGASALVGSAVFALLVLSGISLSAWRARRRAPWLIVGWLWFLGVLVPMIGLVQVGLQAMADRYAYLSLIGLSLPLAWGLERLCGRWVPRHAPVALAVVVVVIALAATRVTRRQVAVWQDHLSLFRHALEVTENNALAHYNVGTGLLRGDPPRIDLARPHLEAAVRLAPDNAGAHLNLGAVAWSERRLDEATRHYEAAVRLAPDVAEARLSLGAARFEAGRVDEAVAELMAAIRLDPDNAKALANLATIYLALGRPVDARHLFERALESNPEMPQARAGLEAAGGVRR